MTSTVDDGAHEPTEIETETSKGCDEIIKSFREGQLTKAVAVTQIFAILNAPTIEVEDSQCEGAFDSYFQLLEQHEEGLRAANECGR